MPRTEQPLVPDGTKLTEFAADLRKLREQAGRPPYRELARLAHYSSTTLSDAAAGRKLPSLDVTLAFVRACEGDEEEWTERWNAVTAEMNARSEPARIETGQPPYAGLAPFGPDDSGRFFGRERVIDQVLSRLAEKRFIGVFGASGAGKSSVLRAGVVPRLGQGPVLVVTPGSLPAGGLTELVERDRAEVVVVDQFEEIFTVRQDEHAFIAELIGLSRDRCRIVAGVRADFFAHCSAHADLVEAWRDAQITVGPMTAAELRAAITRPAIDAGCVVEGALVTHLVMNAHGRAGVLPLLSHVLLETWRRRHGKTLTLAAFHAAGGIDGALAKTAESLFTTFDSRQREATKQLFRRLIAPGEGTEDTKRRVPRHELPPSMDVLGPLAEARLVTVDGDGVEITHEALIRAWPRLRDWLAEDRDGLRLHRRLSLAAADWESLDRDPGALYRGAGLELARGLSTATLAPREREFLDASLAAEAVERAAAERGARRRRQLIAVLTVLLVLTAGTTFYAVRAENEISGQRNVALAEKVAANAVALRQTNPALAAQLSVAAYRLSPTRETRDGLLATMAVPLEGHTQVVGSVAFSPDGRVLATGSFDHTAALWDISDSAHPRKLSDLTGHADLVTTVAFSADGRSVATSGRDNTIRLWDVSDPRKPALLNVFKGHTDTVYMVKFSPDGRFLATGSYDKTARLWDVKDPARSTVLTGHTLSVKPVAFSPDGHVLATGSDDRTIRLWDVSDPLRPSSLTVLKGHTDLVASLVFSPDGRTLATGANDHTARLWDVRDPRQPLELATLSGHSDIVSSVAFSNDGRRLSTASFDHTARIWDVSDLRHPVDLTTLTGHAGAVNSTAFSPDGRLVATASDDHTAQLWDTDLARVEAKACATPPISRADWDHHLPGLTYNPPCD
ncbi:WD domain-containing protein, G-beta repeat-containing protein [Amycolatopsis xylanica]|uniref:WD domain-containing protein, G-beta repeat-containing protein n=1 Tax=Amycolatopsis xylanica TaxID=589385 RepID=A0A1H3PD11_9PSEU|nr:hypothetical protein [Amycolatopsis xylanica]SDY98843.1 WD domain-containing protein, G-beta repeat-containing protein [Amycolatopsis xylanica]